MRESTLGSKIEKSKKLFSNQRCQSATQIETDEEQLNVAIVYASLKDMPLKERRKEAEKPLFLIRY
jgi:hypothetical protein